MATYSISEEAIRDLDEISDYFARQSIDVGERWNLYQMRLKLKLIPTVARL